MFPHFKHFIRSFSTGALYMACTYKSPTLPDMNSPTDKLTETL